MLRIKDLGQILLIFLLVKKILAQNCLKRRFCASFYKFSDWPVKNWSKIAQIVRFVPIFASFFVAKGKIDKKLKICVHLSKFLPWPEEYLLKMSKH